MAIMTPCTRPRLVRTADPCVRGGSSPGVRPSRRRQARAREHHGGVRQRPGARRRRPRDRRPPLARRRARRHPRPDARSHDRSHRARSRRSPRPSWRASMRALTSAPTAAFPFAASGIGVPTLEAVLARLSDARVIIEMKGGTARAGARRRATSVRRHGAVERACARVVPAGALDAARAIAPEIATSASQPEARWTLHRSWVRWPWVSARPYVGVPGARARRPPARRLAGLRAAGAPQGHVVQVWVVNERRRHPSGLLDWGVDGIIIGPARHRGRHARMRWDRADARPTDSRHDLALIPSDPARRLRRARAHRAAHVPARRCMRHPLLDEATASTSG